VQTSELLERHGFKLSHVYLLELIPIIEMMWADERNQAAEVGIMRTITQRHLDVLNQFAEGVTVISSADVDEFLNKLTTTRPSAELLKALRDITIDHLKNKGQLQAKNQTIFNYCVDMAAACVTQFPYKFDERIVESEKQLLLELIQALDLNADEPVSKLRA